MFSPWATFWQKVNKRTLNERFLLPVLGLADCDPCPHFDAIFFPDRFGKLRNCSLLIPMGGDKEDYAKGFVIGHLLTCVRVDGAVVSECMRTCTRTCMHICSVPPPPATGSRSSPNQVIKEEGSVVVGS